MPVTGYEINTPLRIATLAWRNLPTAFTPIGHIWTWCSHPHARPENKGIQGGQLCPPSHLESATKSKQVGGKVRSMDRRGCEHSLHAVALGQLAQLDHLGSGNWFQIQYISRRYHSWRKWPDRISQPDTQASTWPTQGPQSFSEPAGPLLLQLRPLSLARSPQLPVFDALGETT